MYHSRLAYYEIYCLNLFLFFYLFFSSLFFITFANFFTFYYTLLFLVLLKEMSTEPIANKSGRPFSEVWNGHMIKGSQTSRGHYAAECSYCHYSWKQGKPHVLREHLA